jgi:transposase-like protein
MEDYPRTLMEFEKRFATEEDCRSYLAQLRWPDGIKCPDCGSTKTWEMDRGLYLCSDCRYQASALAGTIFQDTKKPLQLWFRAMWYVTNQKNGVSALGLQRTLGLGSYHTAWEWLHKLRRAMVRPGREKLSGKVEIDETFVGGEKSGKRGRGAEGKELVVIATEIKDERMGRIRLKRVVDASAQSLEAAIEETVEKGSTIYTDGWRSYSQLAAHGYPHEIVRQTPDVGDNLLPHVNRIAALLKRWLLGSHQGAVRPDYLDYYLDEFTFRFNRRDSKWRGKLFYRLLQQAVEIEPVSLRVVE